MTNEAAERLREPLTLALHQTRRSNRDPEFVMDSARERMDRMLRYPNVQNALAAEHRATVERIRERLQEAWSQEAALAILDEEAAR